MTYKILNLEHLKKGFTKEQIIKIRTELLQILNVGKFDDSEIVITAKTFELAVKNNKEMILDCLKKIGTKVVEAEKECAIKINKNMTVIKTKDNYCLINKTVAFFDKNVKFEKGGKIVEPVEFDGELEKVTNLNDEMPKNKEYKRYNIKIDKQTFIVLAKNKKEGFLLNGDFKKFMTADFRLSADRHKIYFYKKGKKHSMIMVLNMDFENFAKNFAEIPAFVETSVGESVGDEVKQIIMQEAKKPKKQEKHITEKKKTAKHDKTGEAINYLTKKAYCGKNAEILPTGEYLTATQANKIGLKLKEDAVGYWISAVFEANDGKTGHASYKVFNFLDFEKMTKEEETKRIDELIAKVA